MTEQEWQVCDDPEAMLRFLNYLATDRKLRLFAVGCCRGVWELLTHEPCRKAVEVGERFADGQASEDEAWAADQELNEILMRWPDPPGLQTEAMCSALRACQTDYPWEQATMVIANMPSRASAHASIVRELFGPVAFRLERELFDPTWRTATVTSVARAIYNDRAFDRLPILADALEDAGCTNADILHHCRQPGEHVLGCWALDLLLGKQ